MFDLKLTPAQEQLLRGQVIDTQRPGPVLHDFQIVLDFVGSKGVEAAGKYNLLPISAIMDLNERLSRPLLLAKMKRPLLRSHPYLQGLHLLLCASGLGRVTGSGSKARLVVDAATLTQWENFNPTEQHFTLLEAWLRFGRPEMVGEQASWGNDPLLKCQQVWRELPAKGVHFNVDRPEAICVPGLYRGYYHLALLDLFGLLEVEQPRHAVKPWCPAAVQHRPFGDAVFTLLGQHFPLGALSTRRAEENEDQEEDEEVGGFGAWQPLFQPYFPEWRQKLVLPALEPREGIFIFRVTLGPIWRRIAMPADATLDDLLGWILRSIRFDSDHLYEFRYRDDFGAEVRASPADSDGGPWSDEVVMAELPLQPGQAMTLIYDFGDNWQFNVKLERIEPPGTKIKAPQILEKEGKAPEQYPDAGW